MSTKPGELHSVGSGQGVPSSAFGGRGTLPLLIFALAGEVKPLRKLHAHLYVMTSAHREALSCHRVVAAPDARGRCASRCTIERAARIANRSFRAGIRLGSPSHDPHSTRGARPVRPQSSMARRLPELGMQCFRSKRESPLRTIHVSKRGTNARGPFLRENLR